MEYENYEEDFENIDSPKQLNKTNSFDKNQIPQNLNISNINTSFDKSYKNQTLKNTSSKDLNLMLSKTPKRPKPQSREQIFYAKYELEILKIHNFLEKELALNPEYQSESILERENIALLTRIKQISNLLSVMLEDENFKKNSFENNEISEKLFQLKKRNNYKMLSVLNEDYLRLQRQYELMILSEYPKKMDEQIIKIKEEIKNQAKKIHETNYFNKKNCKELCKLDVEDEKNLKKKDFKELEREIEVFQSKNFELKIKNELIEKKLEEKNNKILKKNDIYDKCVFLAKNMKIGIEWDLAEQYKLYQEKIKIILKEIEILKKREDLHSKMTENSSIEAISCIATIDKSILAKQKLIDLQNNFVKESKSQDFHLNKQTKIKYEAILKEFIIFQQLQKHQTKSLASLKHNKFYKNNNNNSFGISQHNYYDFPAIGKISNKNFFINSLGKKIERKNLVIKSAEKKNNYYDSNQNFENLSFEKKKNYNLSKEKNNFKNFDNQNKNYENYVNYSNENKNYEKIKKKSIEISKIDDFINEPKLEEIEETLKIKEQSKNYKKQHNLSSLNNKNDKEINFNNEEIEKKLKINKNSKKNENFSLNYNNNNDNEIKLNNNENIKYPDKNIGKPNFKIKKDDKSDEKQENFNLNQLLNEYKPKINSIENLKPNLWTKKNKISNEKNEDNIPERENNFKKDQNVKLINENNEKNENFSFEKFQRIKGQRIKSENIKNSEKTENFENNTPFFNNDLKKETISKENDEKIIKNINPFNKNQENTINLNDDIENNKSKFNELLINSENKEYLHKKPLKIENNDDFEILEGKILDQVEKIEKDLGFSSPKKIKDQENNQIITNSRIKNDKKIEKTDKEEKDEIFFDKEEDFNIISINNENKFRNNEENFENKITRIKKKPISQDQETDNIQINSKIKNDKKTEKDEIFFDKKEDFNIISNNNENKFQNNAENFENKITRIKKKPISQNQETENIEISDKKSFNFNKNLNNSSKNDSGIKNLNPSNYQNNDIKSSDNNNDENKILEIREINDKKNFISNKNLIILPKNDSDSKNLNNIDIFSINTDKKSFNFNKKNQPENELIITPKNDLNLIENKKNVKSFNFNKKTNENSNQSKYDKNIEIENSDNLKLLKDKYGEDLKNPTESPKIIKNIKNIENNTNNFIDLDNLTLSPINKKPIIINKNDENKENPNSRIFKKQIINPKNEIKTIENQTKINDIFNNSQNNNIISPKIIKNIDFPNKTAPYKKNKSILKEEINDLDILIIPELKPKTPSPKNNQKINRNSSISESPKTFNFSKKTQETLSLQKTENNKNSPKNTIIFNEIKNLNNPSPKLKSPKNAPFKKPSQLSPKNKKILENNVLGFEEDIKFNYDNKFKKKDSPKFKKPNYLNLFSDNMEDYNFGKLNKKAVALLGDEEEVKPMVFKAKSQNSQKEEKTTQELIFENFD